MERVSRVTGAVCVFALLVGATLIAGGDVSAQGPARLTKIIVPYTEYEWWLIRWVDNEIVCTILVDHEGPPTVKEAISSCGLELATEWFYTPPCKVNQVQDTTTCQGLYIFLVSSQPKQREVLVELPPPVAWVNLEGCTPIPPENLCPTLPVLLLTGEEPLPDY